MTKLYKWLGPLMVAAVGGWLLLIWGLPSPPEAVAIVGICRDGSRIYQRADGSHYARAGLGRLTVPNPETVCK